MQNIPSHVNSIRMMFVPTPMSYGSSELIDNRLCFSDLDEVNTSSGWKGAKKLKVGDKIIIDDESSGNSELHEISRLEMDENFVAVYI